MFGHTRRLSVLKHVLLVAGFPVWGTGASEQVDGASIGLYAGECGSIPLGFSSLSIKALAHSGDSGIQAAQFVVQGLPEDLMVLGFTPNPDAATATGDPFGTGASISFHECQPGEELVTLYTVHVLNWSEQPVIPNVTIRGIPSLGDPDGGCATVTLCGQTAECATDRGIDSDVAAPARPIPDDGATGVALDVLLKAHGRISCQCAGLPVTRVHFGTEPDPPEVRVCVHDYDCTRFSGLTPRTRYYWRFVVDYCGYRTTSPVWSFTTGDETSVDPASWTRMKSLYRD